jgi:hypothetical protein
MKKQFRSFEDARKFAQSLNLKSGSEWNEFCKTNKKPKDIPKTPLYVYKKDYKNMGDWLGTGTISAKEKSKMFMQFAKAKKFVHSLKLKSQKEWFDYCKSGKKPNNIPQSPHRTYSEFKGYGDWLGTGNPSPGTISWKSFSDAKKFVRSLKLKTGNEWKKYSKSKKKPSDIPNDPPSVYKKEWKGMGDWLGTGTIAPMNRKFKTYTETRKFVRSLGVKTEPEWQKWCKTHKKPLDIPFSPERTFKKEWTTMGEWFGTGRIADKNKVWRSFTEARKFAHQLGLKNVEQWRTYCKSEKLPVDIPKNPNQVYKKEWTTMGEWLGTGRIGNRNKEWLEWSEAKEEYKKLAKKYGLRNISDWKKFTASGKKPDNIPAKPWMVYSEKSLGKKKK